MTTFYCSKCGGYIGGDLPDIKDMKMCTCDIEINLPPQKQPFRCPVCYGKGTVYPVLTEYWEKEWLNRDGTTNKPCHSCNGTGIVWG